MWVSSPLFVFVTASVFGIRVLSLRRTTKIGRIDGRITHTCSLFPHLCYSMQEK